MSAAIQPLPQEDLLQVLQNTIGLWNETRGRHLLITGGTGFFGTWLVESIAFINETLGLDLQISVLSRDPDRFLQRLPHLANQRGLHFIPGDLNQLDYLALPCDYIVHAASPVLPNASSSQAGETFLAMVEGARAVLRLVERAHASKLVLISSGAVYGRQPPEIELIDEDYDGGPDLLEASSAYGHGKRAVEFLGAVGAKNSGCCITIARCFAFVGPHLPLNASYAAGNFIRDALAGQPIQVKGSGLVVRSYMYTADLATWLWTILFRGAPARPYNVGSPVAVSMKDLASIIATSVQPRVAVNVRGHSAGEERSPRYVPNVRRAQNELGLKICTDLNAAVAKTISWIRQA